MVGDRPTGEPGSGSRSPSHDPGPHTFRQDRPLEVALFGLPGPTANAITWCFIGGSLAHLWLLDAWQWSWLFPNLLYLAGLGLLVWRRAAMGWALAALGALLPLFVGQDQLTQSVLLFAMATAGGVATAVAGWRRVYHQDSDAPQRCAVAMARFFQGTTVLTYAMAAFHKSNRDFLDPQWSCAVYGMEKLQNYWHTSPFPQWLLDFSPHATLMTEGGIAILLLVGLRRWAWVLAVAFHIPLTLTMAPAFAFVMLIGHSAFATEDDLNLLRGGLRRFGPGSALAGVLLTAASLWAHQGLPEWTMIPREWLLWTALCYLPLALPLWRRGSPQPKASGHRWKMTVAAGLTLLTLHAMTPYTGLQFHHTAAMLSNLRIDPGCWNSFLVPERVRVLDDYVRIDRAHLIAPGKIPHYEDYFERHLWSPRLLRYVRGNWCKPSVRPIHLEGTWRGQHFVIDDLCSDDPLPVGAQWLDGMARFQKFLERRCPQACIH